VEQLESERQDLRQSLELAKERAERVLFRKDQVIDYCPTDSMRQNEYTSSTLLHTHKMVSDGNKNHNEEDYQDLSATGF
jgi:hypothetical protein